MNSLWKQGEINMNQDEVNAAALVSEMTRLKLTLTEAMEAMKIYENDKQFQKDLDERYNVMVFDDWDYWSEGDIF
jgi:ribosomal 50S subunit-recycling heat shock protein